MLLQRAFLQYEGKCVFMKLNIIRGKMKQLNNKNSTTDLITLGESTFNFHPSLLKEIKCEHKCNYFPVCNNTPGDSSFPDKNKVSSTSEVIKFSYKLHKSSQTITLRFWLRTTYSSFTHSLLSAHSSVGFLHT